MAPGNLVRLQDENRRELILLRLATPSSAETDTSGLLEAEKIFMFDKKKGFRSNTPVKLFESRARLARSVS